MRRRTSRIEKDNACRSRRRTNFDSRHATKIPDISEGAIISARKVANKRDAKSFGSCPVVAAEFIEDIPKRLTCSDAGNQKSAAAPRRWERRQISNVKRGPTILKRRNCKSKKRIAFARMSSSILINNKDVTSCPSFAYSRLSRYLKLMKS